MRTSVRASLLALLEQRYVPSAIASSFLVAHLLALGAVLLVCSGVEMTGAELGRVVAVSQVALAAYNVSQLAHLRHLLKRARPWLAGDRTTRAAVAAWHAFAALPRHRFGSPWIYLEWALLGTVSAAYAAYEIDPPLATALPILLLVSSIVVVSLAFVRYFVLELAIEPVLRRVSQDLPEAFWPKRTTSLRTLLMIALPAMNLITGFVVAAVAGERSGDLSSIGSGALIAIACAATISLALSLLVAHSVLQPITALREGTRRVADGDLGAQLAMTRTDETGELTASFNEMVINLRENEALRAGFGAFVDPALVDRVLLEGPVLAGNEVDATVLCVDLRGFTAQAEEAMPRELLAYLNDFYELIIPIVLRHGGHVNTFLGDGLIAIFGAPIAGFDHARRAVLAAREIDDVLRCGSSDPEVGIGVNSGPVVVGTIGGAGRLAFTAIGDAVNIAVRVESMTRETGDVVLVTESTRNAVDDGEVRFEERGDVMLKGKRDPVRVFAALPEPRQPVSGRLAPAAGPQRR